jgi:hypothetical protein
MVPCDMQGVAMSLATIAQMAAMEWSAADLRQREQMWAQYTALNEAMAEAICILGKDQNELVGAVTKDYDRLGPWLERFSSAIEFSDRMA